MQLLYPDQTGIGNVGFSGGRKTKSTWRKTLKARCESSMNSTDIIWDQDRIETRPHCLWWEVHVGALTTVPAILTKESFSGVHTFHMFALRRLERVFRCYIVCGMKEDYKEGSLMMWTNYMSPCNSIVGLYFKGTCDIISVTMAMHKVHKSVF